MIDFAKLAAQFSPASVSWRVGSTTADKSRGMALAYLDARDVMDRLDEVCGPDGWQCRYSHVGAITVCEIGVCNGDWWIWKADGAGQSDIEAEKGALSDAFKRAAVRWGIGRYLYNLPSPWVELETRGRTSVIKESEYSKLTKILQSASASVKGVDGPGSSWGPAGKQGAVDDAKADGLMETPKLSPEGLAKVQKKVNDAAGTMKLSGQSTNSLDTFWKASKAEFDWIKHNVPAEYKRLEAVYNDARDAAEARMQPNTLMAG